MHFKDTVKTEHWDEGGKQAAEALEDYFDSILAKNTVKQAGYCTTNSRSDGSMECTFKPKILKKSHELVRSMKPSFARLTEPTKSNSSHLPYKEAAKNSTGKYSVNRIEQLSRPRQAKAQSHEQ